MTEPRKFYSPIKVRYNETDRQGHVNFGHYLFYFDAALSEFMQAIGYNHHNLAEDETDFLFVEAHCNYKSPAYWPETLNVFVRAGHVGDRSLRFEFEVRAKEDERTIATGHIAVVTVCADDFELRAVPSGLLEAIRKYQGDLPRDDAAP
jgi:acyl-CoA thioester hydrolase